MTSRSLFQPQPVYGFVTALKGDSELAYLNVKLRQKS